MALTQGIRERLADLESEVHDLKESQAALQLEIQELKESQRTTLNSLHELYYSYHVLNVKHIWLRKRVTQLEDIPEDTCQDCGINTRDKENDSTICPECANEQ